MSSRLANHTLERPPLPAAVKFSANEGHDGRGCLVTMAAVQVTNFSRIVHHKAMHGRESAAQKWPSN